MQKHIIQYVHSDVKPTGTLEVEVTIYLCQYFTVDYTICRDRI